MLDLRSANTKRERAECAMGARVTITTYDSHARLRESKLRTDDVDNTLLGRVHIKEPNSEFAAIVLQCFDLFFCDRIKNWSAAGFSWDVVVNRGDRPKGLANFAPSGTQAIKCLRRSDLVDEMQIDVQERRLACGTCDNMLVPNFFEEGP